MSNLRNRVIAPVPNWHLPIVPPTGIGVATPGCNDRSDIATFPVRVGVGLRIGGEASLCHRCGPEGSVYHPSALLDEDGTMLAATRSEVAFAMAELRRRADRLPFVTGYDPADLTPAVMAEYEQEMRRLLGLQKKDGS